MKDFDYVQKAENRSRAEAALALAVLSDSRLSHPDERAARFKASAWGHLHHLTKSAVTPIDSGDVFADSLPFASAFLAGVDQESILGRIEGPLRLDLRTAARILIGEVEATSVAEGEVKPVVKLQFQAATDRPNKVVAEIVVSNEAVVPLNQVAIAGVNGALTTAGAKTTDAHFVDVLQTAAGAPEASADVGALLSAISSGSPSRPALISDWSGILSAAGSIQDLLALRELGIQILITPQAAGVLVAVDAAGLLISDSGGTITTARHATITLDDGVGSPTGTTTVSLWQANLTAIRLERWLKIVARPGAVAYASLGS